MSATKDQYYIYGRKLDSEFGRQKKTYSQDGNYYSTGGEDNYSYENRYEYRNDTVSIKRKKEMEDALNLFGYHNVADITISDLNKKRISMIKKYHPDTNTAGEETAKKINAAYDLLKKYAKGGC